MGYDKDYFEKEISELKSKDSLVKLVADEYDLSYKEAIKLIELNMLTEVYNDYQNLYSRDLYEIISRLAR